MPQKHDKLFDLLVLPLKTNSSPLKMDGWNIKFPFWMSYFQNENVSFRGSVRRCNAVNLYSDLNPSSDFNPWLDLYARKSSKRWAVTLDHTNDGWYRNLDYLTATVAGMNVLNLSTLTNCLCWDLHMMVQKTVPTRAQCVSPPKGGAMARGHRAVCNHGEADATGHDGARKIYLVKLLWIYPVTVKHQDFLHF